MIKQYKSEYLCGILLRLADFCLLTISKFLTDLYLDEYELKVPILHLPKFSGEENEFFSLNPTLDKGTFSEFKIRLQ